MKWFWILLYNLIFYPVLFVFALFGSLFDKKIRKGMIGRISTVGVIKKYFKNRSINKIIYWFHSSSYGEYLQIEPVIRGVKEIEPETIILLSFSSPSGYDQVEAENIDCKIYLPFDFPWTIYRVFQIVNPRKMIFASYDIWPNWIWIGARNKIHTNVIAARIKDHSNKTKPVFRNIYRSIYGSMASIYTVTEKDHIRIRSLVGSGASTIIRVLGDPRYDQVKTHADDYTRERVESLLDREKRLVTGSMHSEDEQIILKPLISYMLENNDLKVLWVPHEPSVSQIKRLIKLFQRSGLSVGVIGSKNNLTISDEQLVIVSVVGILSKLYWQAQVAYVGGGFSTGIHNVMEPAIARLPVIFGPKYHHAHEAEELLESGGGFCVKTGEEFIGYLSRILSSRDRLTEASYSATNVIHQNIGSSTRIVRGLIRD